MTTKEELLVIARRFVAAFSENCVAQLGNGEARRAYEDFSKLLTQLDRKANQ